MAANIQPVIRIGQPLSGIEEKPRPGRVSCCPGEALPFSNA
jgi:hypothetical protein